MMLSFSVTLLRRIEIKPRESSIYWELQAIKAPQNQWKLFRDYFYSWWGSWRECLAEGLEKYS